MSDYDLSDQYVKDTFDGLLHMGGVPLPSTGLSVVSDGVGNQSSLAVGKIGEGVKISGLLTSDRVYASTFVETGFLKAGNVNYPVIGSNQNLIDLIYPVGSVYLTMRDVSPASFFGGVWSRTAEGGFIAGIGLGTDQNGTSKAIGLGKGGGEYQTTLNDSTMPRHTHPGYVIGMIDAPPNGGWSTAEANSMKSPTKFNVLSGKKILSADKSGHEASGDGGSPSINRTVDSYYIGESILEEKGGGLPHDNTPPVFGMFIYTRVA